MGHVCIIFVQCNTIQFGLHLLCANLCWITRRLELEFLAGPVRISSGARYIMRGAGHGRVPYPDLEQRPGRLVCDRPENMRARSQQSAHICQYGQTASWGASWGPPSGGTWFLRSPSRYFSFYWRDRRGWVSSCFCLSPFSVHQSRGMWTMWENIPTR